MLTHPTEQRLIDLGLAGMAKALEEQRRLPDLAALTFEERLGLLVDREALSRNNKRLGSRLKFAGLRQAAVVEDVDMKASRQLDKPLFAKLAAGDWIDVVWERRERLAGLDEILLRPIRPEDEHLYAALIARQTPEDLRMRFFTPNPNLSHKLIARLTQIDYAREMAFVAIGQSSGELLGISRLSADPEYERAEYAVVVRSDLKGRGFGWRLMQHLIEYARHEGLKVLYGNVLTENTIMLHMCAELGFDIVTDPVEPTLRKVTLALTGK